MTTKCVPWVVNPFPTERDDFLGSARASFRSFQTFDSNHFKLDLIRGSSKIGKTGERERERDGGEKRRKKQVGTGDN